MCAQFTIEIFFAPARGGGARPPRPPSGYAYALLSVFTELVCLLPSYHCKRKATHNSRTWSGTLARREDISLATSGTTAWLRFCRQTNKHDVLVRPVVVHIFATIKSQPIVGCNGLSRLQLHVDVRHVSLGRRHLVNTYEVKAAIGVRIAGKTMHAWCLACTTKNEHYINTLALIPCLFTFYFHVENTAEAK